MNAANDDPPVADEQAKTGGEHQQAAQDNKGPAEPMSAGVNVLQANKSDDTANNGNTEGKNQTSNGDHSESIRNRDWTLALFLAFLSGMAILISGLQTYLIYSANQLSTKALKYSAESADAANQSAVAAKKAIEMADAGEARAESTAKAIENTATATKESATALATVADANAKSAVANEKVAAISERALDVSLAATEIATRAATAAEVAAKAAEESNKISTETSKIQLRAYVTLDMEPRPLFVPYSNGRGFEITLNFQNSGLTPATKIEVRTSPHYLRFDRHGKLDPTKTELLNGDGMTIGPSGQWPVFVKHVFKQGDHIDGQPCVIGRIDYEDIYGDKRFTNFFLFQGPVEEKGRGFETIFGEYSNDSN